MADSKSNVRNIIAAIATRMVYFGLGIIMSCGFADMPATGTRVALVLGTGMVTLSLLARMWSAGYRGRG